VRIGDVALTGIATFKQPGRVRKTRMKNIAALALLGLMTGCYRSPADKRADQQAADAQANVLDNYSNLLDARAKQKQDNRRHASDIDHPESDNIAIAASVPQVGR